MEKMMDPNLNGYYTINYAMHWKSQAKIVIKWILSTLVAGVCKGVDFAYVQNSHD